MPIDTDKPANYRALSGIALIASTGTLLCCALPIVLVSLGLGAAVASLTSALPILVTLADQKSWLFLLSASLLAVTAAALWMNPAQCPSDPQLAARCTHAQVWNKRIFWVAAAVWLFGLTAAYLLLPMRNFLGL